ncbi:MAG TPA: hypothetical protein VHA53_02945 [Nitrolancea sp.]|nr:hypothetical protein [Nitrolancea sp.]
MGDSSKRHRYGEVIETSSARIWVECDTLNALPPLGALTQVDSEAGDTIFAVVAFSQTTGIDATRRAVRRGSDEVRDADVYRRHPELTRVLRSTFEAIPVAFERDGRVVYVVPPVPPPLHYSVAQLDHARIERLTDRFDYLVTLSRYQGDVAAEQVVISHVRAVFDARNQDRDWLDRAAAEISRLYANDYDRLLPILEAIDPGDEPVGLRIVR